MMIFAFSHPRTLNLAGCSGETAHHQWYDEFDAPSRYSYDSPTTIPPMLVQKRTDAGMLVAILKGICSALIDEHVHPTTIFCFLKTSQDLSWFMCVASVRKSSDLCELI